MTLPVDELIERLEKLTGPSREADAEIAARLKVPPPNIPWAKNWTGEWKAINGLVHLLGEHGSHGSFYPLAYTKSVDAALPDEDIVSMVHVGGMWAAIAFDQGGDQHRGESSTNEAIARRIAALRAIKATQEK